MDATVIVGIIAAIASLGGSFIGALLNNKVMSYKVEQLEQKTSKIDAIENTQITIQGELDSFVQNAGERRRMVDEMRDEIAKLKSEMQAIQLKINTMERDIKFYHEGMHKHDN